MDTALSGVPVPGAQAGELDVFIAGDQPAINLLADGGQWKIVARLVYDRVSVMVPPDSPIQEIGDLLGKTVASPFGSVGHRDAIMQQQAAGLDPELDVNNLNLDILEIRRHVLAHGTQDWGEIDAVAVWEPIGSRFELEGLARELTSTRTLGVVVASDDFIARHPDAAVRLLMALTRAWDYFSRHPDRVAQWYLDDTQLGYEPETLRAAASLDPNFTAESLREIDLSLHEEHIVTLEQGAAWGRKFGTGGPEMRPFVDQSLLDRAKEEIATAELEEIQVILSSTRTAPPTDQEDYGLDALPLGLMFALMVLIALLAIESGLWLGKRRKKFVVMETIAPVATVGFQFGIGVGKRILVANLALAMTFAMVMLLVFDLDRAGEGLIAVTQQPMINLYQSMHTAD